MDLKTLLIKKVKLDSDQDKPSKLLSYLWVFTLVLNAQAIAIGSSITIRYGFLTVSISSRGIDGTTYGLVESSIGLGFALGFLSRKLISHMLETRKCNPKKVIVFCMFMFAWLTLTSGLIFLVENNLIFCTVSLISRLLYGFTVFMSSYAMLDIARKMFRVEFDFVNGMIQMGFFTGQGLSVSVGTMLYERMCDESSRESPDILHSTPRTHHISQSNLPVSIDQYVVLSPSLLDETNSPPPESIHSVESEADIIERTIQNQQNVDLAELSKGANTTAVITTPIMHPNEIIMFNPGALPPTTARHYFDPTSTMDAGFSRNIPPVIPANILPPPSHLSPPRYPPPHQSLPQQPLPHQSLFPQQSALQQPLSQSAILQQIISQPAPEAAPPPSYPSVPLMSLSQVPLQNMPSGRPRGLSHLGRRAITSPPPSQPTPNPETTAQSPTSPADISYPQDTQNISPISSHPITPHPVTQPPAHWYYSNPDGSWTPFSFLDSLDLEEAHCSNKNKDPTICTDIVRTDGGRFDVSLSARQRMPIYWEGISSAIRRCTWFYRGNNEIMQPYNEDIAQKLEDHYCTAVRNRMFPVRVEFGTEVVLINSAAMIVQYSIHSTEQEKTSPTLVKRGVPDIDMIPPDEQPVIDQLVFVVHGIGGDLRYKSFVDCVNSMRTTTQSLISEHWDKLAPPSGTPTVSPPTKSPEPIVEETVKRPIVPLDLGSLDLHDMLSKSPTKPKSEPKKEEAPEVIQSTQTEPSLAQSTLPPEGRIEYIPIQWHAALHTDTLGIDRLLEKITLPSIPKLRDFVNGTCVDVLFYTSPHYCQAIVQQCGEEMNRLYRLFMSRNPDFIGEVSLCGHSLGSVIAFDILSNQEQGSGLGTSTNLSRQSTPTYDKTDFVKEANNSGTGQPHVTPIPLLFNPKHLFTMGSPLGLFLTVRGVHKLGPDFSLPTCPHFYNIFHPYDPVAYRLEPLVGGNSGEPVTLPHHKGRKRMHKEITEQITRVGYAVKKQITDTFSSFYTTGVDETEDGPSSEPEIPAAPSFGALNSGSYIDYMLQESPLEIVNEYLFSLSSHLCYWTSEDTLFLMVREVFRHAGSTPPHLPLATS